MIKLLPFIFISSVSFAGNSSFLSIANDVPKDQRKMLEGDLERLAETSLLVKDPIISRVMDISQPVTNKNLLSWLSQRVRYIVNEDFDFESKYYIEKRAYAYENPGLLPDLPKLVKDPEVDARPDGSRVSTVMTNLGGALYIAGKSSGALLGLKIPGVGKVPVSSPRSGVLMVGKGLFQLRGSKESKVTDVDASYLRLSTLFHEARHSDGNGKTLGMMHVPCPKGHNYEGFAACDFSLNGSYSVGAQTGKMFAENCKTCTAAQKEVLRLDYLDSFSRVVTEIKDMNSNPAQELSFLETLKNGCDLLKKVDSPNLPSHCGHDLDRRITEARRGKQKTLKAPYLDSRPEGKIEKHRGFFGF